MRGEIVESAGRNMGMYDVVTHPLNSRRSKLVVE